MLTEKDKRNSGGKKNAKGNGADKQCSAIVARFIYRDEHSQPYLRVTRTADKHFWQERWDELWRSGAPTGPKIPYRLPELIAATPTQPVYVTEGEGKADLLAALGFISTSASGGAGKWTSDLNKWFKGRHVIVLPDHDEPGARHGQLVAQNLHGIAASVKVVELPGLPHKGDVKQWLETDPSGTRLVRECERAALWQPTANADNKSGHGDGESSGDGSGDDDNLILELSALGALQYAKRRKEAAKMLGIGVGELDKVVAQARPELGGKDDAPVLYEYWIVECSSEPVDGEALLRQLMDCLKRYVVMTEDQTLVVALWIIFTWLHGKIAVHSPLLLVTSPQANSGKSTLLGVISFLACRALQSVSISGPALFRSIEKWQPTFVIDEADTVLVHPC